VNLTWAAASDPEGSVPITYNIWWSTGAITYGVSDATTQSASYQVTGLTTDQPYNFAVRAEDFLGNRETNSTTVSATPTAPAPGPDLTPPAQITLGAATGASVGEVDLSWTAVGDDGDAVGETASFYDIRYSTLDITNDTQFGSATQVVGEPAPQVRDSAEAMTVSGLEPTQTYFFAIKAGDEVPNWGTLSASASTTAAPDTTAPAFGAITAADAATDGAVNLSWSPATDPEDSTPITYFISWTGGSTGNTTTLNGSGYTVTGLVNDSVYTFTVYAEDSAGNPSGSQQDNATPTKPTPGSGGPATLRLDVAAFAPTSWSGGPSDFTAIDSNVAYVYDTGIVILPPSRLLLSPGPSTR
jgi:hypothetical protein